jgi:uncharacterized membrane protein YkvI
MERIEVDCQTGKQKIIQLTSEEIAAIEAIVIPIIIPTLSMRQARLALLSVGLLDEVEAAITTPENRIWWEYSTIVERNHPLVDAVLIALGKSPEEIDQMFIGAAQL